MQITKVVCPVSKYPIKCPYLMTPEYISVHNTANDASAMSEISYMLGNDYETSFHFAVDDYRAVQGLELNRNGWHAGDGNGKGNRKSIGIEICYSKSGGERFTKAEQNAAELIAYLLKEYGWGIDRVKRHKDWSGKYCPHRTMDLGWDRFINLIKSKMSGQPVPENKPAAKKINVTYQVYCNGKWYSDITNYNNTNSNGYAGVMGKAISGFRGNTVGKESEVGNLIYRVHVKEQKDKNGKVIVKGRWLGKIVDRQEDKTGDNFAGILGKPIDGIAIKSTKGTARYRVHTKGGKWLGWITKYNINDYNSGMAGIYGKEIDAIQIEIV